ncbi:MAG TPA: nuclear transport factor 2 family protein [Cytophagales bacterium]|nr:nuclear transport factor 2 family protein [Cytophagales bacterium]
MNSTVLAQSKEEVEVATQVEALRVAMIDGNKANLEALTAEALSYGHSGGHIEDKAEFVEKIVSGKSDFLTIALSNQSIKVVDNIAIVRHDLKGTTNDKGNPSEVSLHVLLVWQKQQGKWLLIARQAVKVAHK